jgi:hypothetical protein
MQHHERRSFISGVLSLALQQDLKPLTHYFQDSTGVQVLLLLLLLPPPLPPPSALALLTLWPQAPPSSPTAAHGCGLTDGSKIS